MDFLEQIENLIDSIDDSNLSEKDRVIFSVLSKIAGQLNENKEILNNTEKQLRVLEDDISEIKIDVAEIHDHHGLYDSTVTDSDKELKKVKLEHPDF